jgi:hypothetical protein
MAAQRYAASKYSPSSANAKQMVQVLLKRYGRTYCDELGIVIERNSPSVLFRWLCATILFSARISSSLALRAAKAITEQGWTTPQKMRAATWEERVRVLNEAGYARFDESTSTKLGSAAELLIRHYDGDLRQLREMAQRDRVQEHRLLQAFKGIGPVGADIFCREAQAAWAELYPFVDQIALASGKRLGIAATPQDLTELVDRKRFSRLVTALVRVRLENAFAEIKEEAAVRARVTKRERGRK